MGKILQVTSMSNWIAREFELATKGTQYKVAHDFGFDAPAYQPYAWWMPTEHAYQIKRVKDLPLIAPGAQWLSTVPEYLLGRKITTLSTENVESWNGKKWVKLAEAKSDKFVAGMKSWKEYQNSGLPFGTQVQFSSDYIPMDNEHRFYVLQGEIATGSTYLLNGIPWNDQPQVGDYSKAYQFAKFAVQELGENQPPAYTLDVAINELTGNWVIIEANPAWSSGFYGSHLLTVIDVLHESMKPSRQWNWVPDPLIVENGKKKRLMKISK